MINKFEFKNFFSFEDEAHVSFKVNKKAPQTDAYVINTDFSVTKVMAVVGPNASGKTNLLKALSFLKFFIVDSFSYKADQKIPFKPFILDGNKNNSEFLVEFQLKGNEYQYKLVLNTEKVTYETFKIKIGNRFSTLFKREWITESKQYSLNLKKFELPSEFSSLLRDNASIFSTANQINHKLSQEIIEYWKGLQSNVNMRGHSSSEDNIINISEFFHKNPELQKSANDLLIKFDLGLAGLEIVEQTIKDESETFFFPVGIHKNPKDSNLPVRLSFFDESRGTQHLYLILSRILKALESGSMVILDEFDTFLHPAMIPELVNLFISPESNRKNAQIFFTTHHPQILSSLDKYQIMLVEKDEAGHSENWRLDEIPGVRSDDNYYAKYMSGAYGATPRL